ncbi:MAG: spermidine/putrescine ABC transporter ATP-binding protein [Roseibacillus sp.]|nr:spermidine/putrescine ABC transporter ATP-binding protein [Roseibacillus sp.]HAO95841.1 spermidine/putrescine ABC transporter ATP-binding protein [Verrucomicrobiales bacterium]|tara:strand:- start:10413 stop:11477 length:1065 start_codon:yes stop_codon:yes gene_type:complete
MDAIRADSVVKDFGEVRALNGVSLGVEAGELFFLLGGSGCGKTTLLRCIAGLEDPTSGKISFDGEDVTALPTHKREAAMVFQSYALWPHMTVGQNIGFGLEERKVPKNEIAQRVKEVLEMVRMPGFEGRGIDQMSGGQQQRVSLARALVVKPKCLLLDEPLSNLDAQLRLEMRSEIRRIVKENGLTGVYVTHDQAEALSMADRLAVMDGGRIVQVGTPEQIYRNPKTSYVASFIGETNLLRGKVSNVAGRGAVAVVTKVGELVGRMTDDQWMPASEDQVQVSIRPEAIRISQEGAQLEGRVIEKMYLGESIQYRVGIGEGIEMQVSEMNPRAVLEEGVKVGLKMQVEDVVVLRD